jgi:hypothetical protein
MATFKENYLLEKKAWKGLKISLDNCESLKKQFKIMAIKLRENNKQSDVESEISLALG